MKYNEQQRKTLDLWIEQSRYCHWWWPYKGIVLASDHPTEIHIDDSGRLHNETAQAITYSDGWGLYAWHGLRVSEELITQPISIKQINKETNAELKRVMMERYGFAKYLTDAGAKPVSKDKYGELYKLPNAQFPVVKVINSSPEPDGSYKEYVLTAARRDVKSAHEAVASLVGLSAANYNPVIET